MRENLKRGFMVICKWLGLFHLARFVTRRSLRIICYHGFALSDESSFRPKLFMRPETFRRRMKLLVSLNYPVLSLEQASESLAKGTLPDCAVVITIDDGFYSVFRQAFPVLQSHSLPATVYVTTYYVRKGNPVFRLVVQYMFWRTQKNELDTTGLRLPRSGVLPLRSYKQKDETMWEIIRFGETQLKEPERCTLASELGGRLGVEYSSLHKARGLSLMSTEEIRDLAKAGIDIQLHTHRHQLPEEQTQAIREIQENREFLEPLAGRKLQHLCYPSGVWSKQHWPWLESLGVVSATTCDPGLNYAGTPPLGLRRFLDAENTSQIEFEAELSGFSEFLRSARAALRG
jgi:peptidoglycan/xylan/chitin deacetylase (PgdA/CDA1 family)